MAAATILLCMEGINYMIPRSQLRHELWFYYILTVLICVQTYLEMFRRTDELRTGKSTNGKVEWPKSTAKLTLFYVLIGLLVVEFLSMTLFLAYVLYKLVVDFCGKPDACNKWFMEGLVKFTDYTRALFGDNACLICNTEFMDFDQMV